MTKSNILTLFTAILMCCENEGTKINPAASIENFNNDRSSVTIDHNETLRVSPETKSLKRSRFTSLEEKKKFVSPAGSILEVNKNILNELIDGDMKPNFFRYTAGTRWPKTLRGRHSGLVRIPYGISSQFGENDRKVIESAMRDIERHTCIRFYQNSLRRARVQVINGNGCWSVVGHTGGRVSVSLKIPGCIKRGVVIHEFLHLLGFEHEHERPDRNNYISIDQFNLGIVALLLSKLGRNPRIQEQTVYDYGSIMHYHKFAFSRRLYLPSIEVYAVNGVIPSIGQRDRLSPYDIEKIKYYYECAPGTFSRCGRRFFRRSEGTFESPNYPGLYGHNRHCVWNITVPRGRFIHIEITNVDIEESKYCMYDALLVHDGRNASVPVLRRICGTSSRISLTSTGNHLYLIFSSDRSKLGRGFQARFQEVTTPGRRPSVLIGLDVPPRIRNALTSFNCTFNDGFCNLTQDRNDPLDFLFHNETETMAERNRFQSRQLPGNYIYLPWKYPALQGDSAVIRSPWFANGNFCITFNYHMYGRYMGGLRLFAFQADITGRTALLTLLWEKLGNQGDKWHTAYIDYNKESDKKYVNFYLQGIKYRHFSILAIRNWAISPGNCSSINQKETSDSNQQGSISSKNTWVRSERERVKNAFAGMPLCTFEGRSTRAASTSRRNIPRRSSNDLGAYSFPRITRRSRMCGWRQSKEDDFDWSRRSGATPSRGTGPPFDTTSGRGNYLYIEASRKRPNDVAILDSYSIFPSDYCFDFNFYMKGKDIGRLSVKAVETLRNNQINTSLLFEVEGNQGQGWKNVELDFSASNDTKSVVFRVEGFVGSSSLGDIAIDDISVFPGACDSCEIASQQGGTQTSATGCVHTGLFWVRCCTSNLLRYRFRRVRRCRRNMFDSSALKAFCRN